MWCHYCARFHYAGCVFTRDLLEGTTLHVVNEKNRVPSLVSVISLVCAVFFFFLLVLSKSNQLRCWGSQCKDRKMNAVSPASERLCDVQC